MKIAVFDETNFKFSRVLIDHWIEQGHTVVKDKMFDPKICVDVDVIFIDWCGIQACRASDPNDPIWEQIGGQVKPKKVIIRAHDIEIWSGQPAGMHWEWVTDLVTVSEHTSKHLYSYTDPPSTVRRHLIKHGIDVDKFTLRKDYVVNNKIAWVGPFNEKKCFELALCALVYTPTYELHAVGHELRNWRKAYVMDFIKRKNLNVTFYEEVPDMNNFLEDKTYLLTSGFKEAFGYIIGEAAAKGIRPLIHHFYGAEGVWPKEWLWDVPTEVKWVLEEEFDPKYCRKYVETHYPFNEMIESYDALLHGCGDSTS